MYVKSAPSVLRNSRYMELMRHPFVREWNIFSKFYHLVFKSCHYLTSQPPLVFKLQGKTLILVWLELIQAELKFLICFDFPWPRLTPGHYVCQYWWVNQYTGLLKLVWNAKQKRSKNVVEWFRWLFLWFWNSYFPPQVSSICWSCGKFFIIEYSCPLRLDWIHQLLPLKSFFLSLENIRTQSVPTKTSESIVKDLKNILDLHAKKGPSEARYRREKRNIGKWIRLKESFQDKISSISIFSQSLLNLSLPRLFGTSKIGTCWLH